MYGWNPPPPVVSTVAVKLTTEWVMRGLYCCGPAGIRTLSQHLHGRGVLFTQQELLAALQAVPGLIRRTFVIGQDPVDLYALPGYGIT